MPNARNSERWLRLLDKLALLRTEPAVQREADELIAILVASAWHRSRAVNADTVPHSRSRSVFRIRPFPRFFLRKVTNAQPARPH